MLKEELKRNEIKYGVLSRLSVSDNVEILGEVGFDFVILDAQNGIIGDSELKDLISAAKLSGIDPIVRVEGTLEAKIAHMLDYSASGVIIPGLTSLDDVKDAVSFTKFPPLGGRGLNYASRSAKHGLVPVKDYLKDSNDNTISMVMIESGEMADIIEDICRIDALDGVFIGPNDLALSLGIPGEMRNEKLLSVIRKVLETAKRCGKIAGVYAGTISDAELYRSYGATFISYNNDLRIFLKAAKESLEKLKEL
ncbi:MAG: aldolase/citrate lyase family protein [Clostridia bacterium]|nr:aldolase/citrate lyase family protein [Clostridia bacterium]